MFVSLNPNTPDIQIDETDLSLISQYTWHIHNGYVAHTVTRKTSELCGLPVDSTLLLHRLLLNPPADMVVDHVSGDKLDNRRSNLRVCLQNENLLNRSKQLSQTSSKFKGVHLAKGKIVRPWRAEIYYQRQRFHIGYFDTETEAAEAYNQHAIVLFGEYANLNKIA